MAWRKENESVKIIYDDIIDTMDMGILILRQAEEPIFYSNKAFFNILELPRYTKWHLVKDHLKAFDPYFSLANWGHIKDVITLKINGKETVFSLRTYVTHIYGERYLIVNLDTLQNIIDRKEKEAWFNLMKVMSHEILNTIAPINSLTHNLTYLVADKKEVLGEDYDDIYQSVNTIKKRTHHLIDFVETYRILAELPTPKPEKVSILELFSDSLRILDTLLETKNIAVTVSVTPKGLHLPLDKKQMEQVIINLITNSVYALEGAKNAGIHLTGHVLNDMAILEVTDNGHGIPEDIKREIFVPFFTTRENGSGIGLSLSKNIVQGHKGTLSFSSKPGRTVFSIQYKLKAF
jgi:signal transduction histidine kinase